MQRSEPQCLPVCLFLKIFKKEIPHYHRERERFSPRNSRRLRYIGRVLSRTWKFAFIPNPPPDIQTEIITTTSAPRNSFEIVRNSSPARLQLRNPRRARLADLSPCHIVGICGLPKSPRPRCFGGISLPAFLVCSPVFLAVCSIGLNIFTHFSNLVLTR